MIIKIVGVFLYYAGAIDNTMLLQMNSFSTQTNSCTKDTMKEVNYFLDYAALHKNASITYLQTDMILLIDNDVSYLIKRKYCRKAGGYLFLSKLPTRYFYTNNKLIYV